MRVAAGGCEPVDYSARPVGLWLAGVR